MPDQQRLTFEDERLGPQELCLRATLENFGVPMPDLSVVALTCRLEKPAPCEEAVAAIHEHAAWGMKGVKEDTPPDQQAFSFAGKQLEGEVDLADKVKATARTRRASRSLSWPTTLRPKSRARCLTGRRVRWPTTSRPSRTRRALCPTSSASLQAPRPARGG